MSRSWTCIEKEGIPHFGTSLGHIDVSYEYLQLWQWNTKAFHQCLVQCLSGLSGPSGMEVKKVSIFQWSLLLVLVRDILGALIIPILYFCLIPFSSAFSLAKNFPQNKGVILSVTPESAQGLMVLSVTTKVSFGDVWSPPDDSSGCLSSQWGNVKMKRGGWGSTVVISLR